MKLTRIARAAVTAFAAAPLVVAPLLVPATAQAAEAASAPETVSADPLPTVQINGVVRDQVVVGNTVYAVGEFTEARPAGSAAGENETPRTNALAYDITTGDLLDWAPKVNGAIYSIDASADGSTLYLGGDFTRINDQNTWYVGAVRADGSRKPLGVSANGRVNAVQVSSDGKTLYIGGSFTQLNSSARLRLGSLDLTTNKLGSLSANIPDFTVRALASKPGGTGAVAVGGSFTSMNGSTKPGYGLGIVEADGTLRQNDINNEVRNANTYGGITSLVSDGTSLYGSGYSQSRSQANIEGSFSANWQTGDLNWLEDCHGDNYDIYPTEQVAYIASHTHDCRNINGQPNSSTRFNFATAYTNYATGKVLPNVAAYYADHQGQPAPTQLNFFPTFVAGTYTGKNQANWTVEGNSDYVVYGGEFTSVNGTAQQGLVRFARRSSAPNQSGPVVTGGNYKVSASSSVTGVVRLDFTADWDRDDRTLTYKVYRDSMDSDPIWTKDVTASYWQLPELVVNDKVDPGSTHKYIVVVSDPWGASTHSDWVTATAAGAGTEPSTYESTVLDDGAAHYWPLDETSGSTAADLLGQTPMSFAGTAYKRGDDSVLAQGYSTSFINSRYTSAFASQTTAAAAPSAFTEEAWIRTSTTTGGVIMGYGSSTTGSSTSKDRMLYMTSAGKLMFMAYPDRLTSMGTTGSYNDGKWHHVVLSMDYLNGATMYVDGEQVAQDASINRGQTFDGFWRIGGDSSSGLPSAPSTYFNGDIDEVAVYPYALSATQVGNHYTLGTTGALPNQAPVAGIQLTPDGLKVSADASASADADGSIASYTWDFGDGSTADGVTAEHTYAQAGTYTVKVTVTDDDGATGVAEQEVTVAKPNEAPTASATATTDGLKVSADASASADADGSIASYTWDFGDGSTADGVTAEHTYAQAGDYTVTLTVTDDQGATSTSTVAVTVAKAEPTVTAEFSSAVTDLDVALDASASTTTADDGVINYAWDLGDGSTATGKTVDHTYAQAGDYKVTLTTTTSTGQSATSEATVTVTAPADTTSTPADEPDATTTLLSDAFGRQATKGWGTADKGGDWTVGFSKSAFSANGSTGVLALQGPGASTAISSATVDSTAIDSTFDMTLESLPTGSGSFISYVGRGNSAGRYQLTIRTASDGTTYATVAKHSGDKDVSLGSTKLHGALSAGQTLHVRYVVNGTDSTALRAKVWTGDTEPEAWGVDVVDDDASLNAAGSVGFRTFYSTNADKGTVNVDIDNLTVKQVG